MHYVLRFLASTGSAHCSVLTVSALLFLLPAKGQKQRDVCSALAPCLLVNWKEGEARKHLLLFKGLWGHSIKGEELSLFNF